MLMKDQREECYNTALNVVLQHELYFCIAHLTKLVSNASLITSALDSSHTLFT